MISQEEFDKRVDELNEKLLSEPPESVKDEQKQQNSTPTDFYQQRRSERLSDANKHTFPRGSRQKVLLATESVIERLGPEYKQAKDDSDYLRSIGDKKRAGWREQQYLEDSFLPAVESIVGFSSVDELLNSKESLAALDKLAMLSNMSGSGFTAAFVRSLHSDESGAFSGTSDEYVIDSIGRIHGMIERDQIMPAISLAKKVQKRIMDGVNLASEDDYQYLSKIVSRG